MYREMDRYPKIGCSERIIAIESTDSELVNMIWRCGGCKLACHLLYIHTLRCKSKAHREPRGDCTEAIGFDRF